MKYYDPQDEFETCAHCLAHMLTEDIFPQCNGCGACCACPLCNECGALLETECLCNYDGAGGHPWGPGIDDGDYDIVDNGGGK